MSTSQNYTKTILLKQRQAETINKNQRFAVLSVSFEVTGCITKVGGWAIER